jgi:F-type H+-transporting ATPase subunit epsilon
MRPFKVKILASDHPFYEGDCYSLTLPTTNGMYGIFARHSNMIAAIVPGTMHYRLREDEQLDAAISGGMFKIENGEVLVLADTIERPEEIDANRARRNADEAMEAMRQRRSIIEYRAAQATLARAMSRLRVKQRNEP